MQFRFKFAVSGMAGIFMLAACGTSNTVNYTPPLDPPTHKKIGIFLDGTANDQHSRTNVTKLYELTVNQNRPDLAAYYTEGVGSGGRVVGMLMGWGIGKDVRDAYQFLSQTYTSGADEIYIFGHSRGSYAARILAGLTQYYGLVDFQNLTEKEKTKFVRALYKGYKGKYTAPDGVPNKSERQAAITKAVAPWQGRIGKPRKVRIKFLGIWDTVEALGIPNYVEDVGEVNRRYVDQICNIDKVYHALSLDDNRARIYTPILMRGTHLTRDCLDTVVEEVVEEVWFSGAHADVGGGYRDGYISGVSLNWMIEKIEKVETDAGMSSLLPKNAAVYGNKFDIIHDAEGYSALFTFGFKRLPRDIGCYIKGCGKNDTRGVLKPSHKEFRKFNIHSSVVERLALQKEDVADIAKLRNCEHIAKTGKKQKVIKSTWMNDPYFEGCFEDGPTGLIFNTACPYLTMK